MSKLKLATSTPPSTLPTANGSILTKLAARDRARKIGRRACTAPFLKAGVRLIRTAEEGESAPHYTFSSLSAKSGYYVQLCTIASTTGRSHCAIEHGGNLESVGNCLVCGVLL